MFRRLLFTVSVTACLCGVYAVYALTVTPLLTPPHIEAPQPVRRAPRPVTAETPIYERLAAKWLGQHAWAQSARYKVGRGRAYIYAEDWEKVQPSGHIRFRPFALIYLAEKPEDEPIVVVSDAALLEFSTPFDETKPKLGRLVGGALEGPVEIDGAKGLSIRTRNVRFSESGLLAWSDEPIEFRLGQNHGRGLGLEMNLLPGPPSDEKPGVSGIRTLRLRKDVVLDLRSKPRGPEGKVEQAHITSAGKFEYQLAERMAFFQDRVHLDHPGKDGRVDTLDCHELYVVFEPKPEAAGTPPPADGTNDEMEGLSFRRMRAVADAAGTQPVKLVSPRAEMSAKCSELTYDAVLRVATLKDGRYVEVTQKRNDLFSPEITIVHEEKGGRIIEALCRGNGRVDAYSAHPEQPHARGPIAFTGRWLTQLHKFPDKETGLDLIEFQGQASLDQPGQIQLGGETIKVWITPDKPERKQDAVADGAVAEKDATDTGKTSTEDARTAQVQRVEAHRSVTFAADKLEGKSEQLVITVEDGQLPIPRPAAIAEKQPPKTSVIRREVPLVVLNDSRTPRGLRGFANVDDPRPSSGVRPATARNVAPPPPGPKAPPLHVEANTIRVKMIRDGRETEAAEVETEGAVKVIQPRAGGAKPVEVHGDWMKLFNYANDEQVVHVIGKPAAVIDSQMELRGANLHLDRGANTARVDGAGTLKLPMTKGMDGQVLTKPQWLTVAWERQMTFDGMLARFQEDVSAVLEENRMNCHEMDVTFTRKVSFLEGTEAAAETPKADGPRIAGAPANAPAGSASAKANGRPSGAEIERIHCKEGVNLFAYEYDTERKLKAYRTGEVFEFTLHQPTGDTTASGPGKMFMWWRGDAVRENLASTATVRANRSRQTDRPAWNFAKVEFADTMRGNAKERISLFQDRVRVLYGPVANTSEQIDPDHLPSNAGWLKSNMLRLVQVQGPGGNFMEMVGQGNAELDGKTGNGLFHALADTVTFDESKGMYILRSEGNRKAAIWRQVTLGSPRSHAEASYMEFNPSRNSLKLDKATGLDGLQ